MHNVIRKFTYITDINFNEYFSNFLLFNHMLSIIIWKYSHLWYALFSLWRLLQDKHAYFHERIIFIKRLPRSIEPTKCFSYSWKTHRSNTITVVYIINFQDFMAILFVATLDICSSAPNLKRGRRKMKCGAIEFSNALLRGGTTII